MIPGKAVGYARIPAVHVGVEVPEKEQRNRARLAKSAVGVTDAIGLNKLCGDRFVRVIAHRLSLSNLIPFGLTAFGIRLVQTKCSAEGDRCGATDAGPRAGNQNNCCTYYSPLLTSSPCQLGWLILRSTSDLRRAALA